MKQIQLHDNIKHWCKSNNCIYEVFVILIIIHINIINDINWYWLLTFKIVEKFYRRKCGLPLHVMKLQTQYKVRCHLIYIRFSNWIWYNTYHCSFKICFNTVTGTSFPSSSASKSFPSCKIVRSQFASIWVSS